jgi:uncharacterized protein
MSSIHPRGGAEPVTTGDKIGFLSIAENYRERTRHVSLLQTHHAWLFMTDRHVYKMKKKTRFAGRDYSSLEARRRLCHDEYRLNRRLAANTYLGVVPLVLNRENELELGGSGRAVEWLVKMVRLPDSCALPIAAANDRVRRSDIDRLARKLLRFWRAAEVCRFDPGAYTDRLRRWSAYWGGELRRQGCGMPAGRVCALLERHREYLDTRERLVEGRAAEGRVREGHGDLRPEHVFLRDGADPEIIDCLEFDADLRRLDCAAEVANLVMELRHLKLSWLERACRESFREQDPDAAGPPHLACFYASLAATTRAGLSVWRAVDDGGECWSRRAGVYLDDAEHYIALALQ